MPLEFIREFNPSHPVYQYSGKCQVVGESIKEARQSARVRIIEKLNELEAECFMWGDQPWKIERAFQGYSVEFEVLYQ